MPVYPNSVVSSDIAAHAKFSAGYSYDDFVVNHQWRSMVIV